jgi:cellulose synthase/poly-beta-1,6-N-acetylglucosamine synthase-like glycosyltransferase
MCVIATSIRSIKNANEHRWLVMDDGRRVIATKTNPCVSDVYRENTSHVSPGAPPSTRIIPLILGRLWANHAAAGLYRRSPNLSARSGLTVGQIIATTVVAFTSALLAWTSPQLTGWMFSAVCGLIFAGLIGLRLAASLTAPRWAERRALPDAVLPRASIIIALYREAAVFNSLVTALKLIDYPADKLEIKFAIEADDPETLAASRAAHLDSRFEVIVVPAGTPRTKPRALNYALRFCTGAYITVHDAEDRPDPAQLRNAIECFAAARTNPNRRPLACIQAPLNWFNRNENWLTRQFAMEYAAHFHALLPLYARLGWPLPLGGTSNHFCACALRRAGGWDAYNVTEDADLGFRLHRLGYRSDVIAPMTMEEAPIRAWPWICQRTRWLKGYAQTVAVHSRPNTGDDEVSPLIPIFFTIGTALLSALSHLPFMLTSVWGLTTGAFDGWMLVTVPAVLSSGYITAALASAAGMRRAGFRARIGDLLTMPLYWPMQTLAALRALWQLINDPYYWDKTEHGISTATQTACTSPLPRRSRHLSSVSSFLASVPGKPDNLRALKKDPK